MNRYQILLLSGGFVILVVSSVLARWLTGASWLTALIVALVFVGFVALGLAVLRRR